MTRPRDSQRSRLFEAERSLVGAPPLRNQAITRDWLREHVVGSFWTRRLKTCGVRHIESWQHPSVSRRMGSQRCYPDVDLGIIWVSDTSTAFTVIHQLAHLLTWDHRDEAWHGRLFAKTYLELTRKFLGDEWYQKLRIAYRQHGVKRTVVSDETRQLRRDAWYERQAREAPKRLAEMIAELEAEAEQETTERSEAVSRSNKEWKRQHLGMPNGVRLVHPDYGKWPMSSQWGDT